ncbi:hypothetical protein NsoK4_01795 [Nitrosopumilus sp. K4]|nr:hypothetical protein NsoK4_01795 [Nitrosopumilus sp. K4]
MAKTIFAIFSLVLVLTVPVFAEVDSPKKQMHRGVSAEEVLCKATLELIIRTNGMPACVKASTAEKMKERGSAFTPTPITKSNKEIQTVPASSNSFVNFYITDQDLNIAHSGIEVIPTEGLLEFSIKGITIQGPENMIETGPDTGQFYVKLQLPESINGEPLEQDDIVLIKYLDQSDHAGEKRILVKSIPLTKTFAKVETSGGGSRIGHEFTFRIYEPDANRDSKNEDKISLSSFEFRAEGGIRTTLANPRFDANSSSLIETGPNTSTFEVKIKIPREIDGKPIHIGDKYEIRYIDRSTPSGTDEKVVYNGRIG